MIEFPYTSLIVSTLGGFMWLVLFVLFACWALWAATPLLAAADGAYVGEAPGAWAWRNRWLLLRRLIVFLLLVWLAGSVSAYGPRLTIDDAVHRARDQWIEERLSAPVGEIETPDPRVRSEEEMRERLNQRDRAHDQRLEDLLEAR